MDKPITVMVAAGLLLCCGTAASAQARVLVYTRNYTADGKGYVHDNLTASVEAIRRMGAEAGFAVDVSDDPKVFSQPNLSRYGALVFSNSNNEAFATDPQRDAFKGYIEGGGGFVGLHSASGSERTWDYFAQVLGGRFAAHPKMQTFTVRVTEPGFTAVKGLPAEFKWTDECYFVERLQPGIHPVLVTDRTKLSGLGEMKIDAESFANPLPLAWWQRFDGGKEFYLALGHNKEDYANPLLYGLIKRGIVWAMRK